MTQLDLFAAPALPPAPLSLDGAVIWTARFEHRHGRPPSAAERRAWSFRFDGRDANGDTNTQHLVRHDMTGAEALAHAADSARRYLGFAVIERVEVLP